MPETIEPGDVFDLGRDQDPVYVQLTHRHHASWDVVRVLRAGSPRNLDALARQDAVLIAMVPLVSAIRSCRLQAHWLGRAAIPEPARAFPTFRIAIRDKKEGVPGDIAYWWFWDGQGLTYGVEPGEAVESLPLRELLSIEEFLRRAREAGSGMAHRPRR